MINTKVLMHMNESTFKDEIGHTVTKSGSPILDTTIKKFKEGSARLASSSCLNVSYSDTDYKTIDFWFNLVSSPQTFNFLFTLTGSTFGVFTNPYRKLSTWYGSSGTSGTTVLDLGTWYHCAVTIDGNAIKVYLNGNLEISATYSLSRRVGILRINGWTDNSNWLANCYIDEFRVSNIIRWTTDFTPNVREYGITVKYLIQDGTELKTISGGNLITVCNTTDDNSLIENSFLTSGLDILTSWNNSLASQIVNNTFKVAIYRKEG